MTYANNEGASNAYHDVFPWSNVKKYQYFSAEKKATKTPLYPDGPEELLRRSIR